MRRERMGLCRLHVGLGQLLQHFSTGDCSKHALYSGRGLGNVKNNNAAACSYVLADVILRAVEVVEAMSHPVFRGLHCDVPGYLRTQPFPAISTKNHLSPLLQSPRSSLLSFRVCDNAFQSKS